MNSEKKEKLMIIVGGILCLVAAAFLLQRFKGRFGIDTAGVATVDLRAGVHENASARSPRVERQGEEDGEKVCGQQNQSE